MGAPSEIHAEVFGPRYQGQQGAAYVLIGRDAFALGGATLYLDRRKRGQV